MVERSDRTRQRLFFIAALLSKWAWSVRLDDVHDDLVLGTWDLRLHCSRSTFHDLFPSRRPVSITDSRSRRKPFLHLRRNYNCILTLFDNHTFVFEPDHRLVAGGAVPDLVVQPHHDAPLPVRGQWQLHANPYCVTDRFYDQLVLESIPRVQRNNTNIIQQVQVELSCRLLGRQQRQRRRADQSRRLRHGTLLWRRMRCDNESDLRTFWWQRLLDRSIKASFVAQQQQQQQRRQHADDDAWPTDGHDDTW